MKNNKKYIVYEHIFPNGMVYVGLTSNDPEKRWGKNGCRYKNKKFYDDIKNYGWENIEHKIIKSNLTVDEAIRIEKELILKYKENGVSYNIRQHRPRDAAELPFPRKGSLLRECGVSKGGS